MPERYRCALIPAVAALIFVCAPEQLLALILHPSDDARTGLQTPNSAVVGWAGSGSAVAIDPNFALVSAHEGVSIGSDISFGGALYRVAEVMQHPTADLRVARLTNSAGAPANLANYVGLYDPAADGNEIGRGVVIGGFGVGRGAILQDDGVPYGYAWSEASTTALRWGANRVEAIQYPGVLMDDFDAASAATAVPFEAALSRYDSGGGWFIRVGNDWKVAGISSFVSHDKMSLYGDRAVTKMTELPDQNGAVRVGAFTDFIHAAMGIPTATVVGRHVFYNGSKYDGFDQQGNASDDGAIAPDKAALLPGGSASFANYTSDPTGINGIMIDIAGLPSAPQPGDFEFKIGNGNGPADWSLLTVAPKIEVRLGAGEAGSDRISLIWPDRTITRQWLQVTMKATANTGLADSDVFYFGNAVGDVGNSSNTATISAADELLVRRNPRSIMDPAEIDSPYDFNRDGLVNAMDRIIVRNNQNNYLSALRLFTAPAAELKASPSPAGAGATVPEPSSLVLLTIALLGLAIRVAATSRLGVLQR